ncbi:hypothetical protein MMPV_008322 [Pyropia vietnamensis]
MAAFVPPSASVGGAICRRVVPPSPLGVACGRPGRVTPSLVGAATAGLRGVRLVDRSAAAATAVTANAAVSASAEAVPPPAPANRASAAGPIDDPLSALYDGKGEAAASASVSAGDADGEDADGEDAVAVDGLATSASLPLPPPPVGDAPIPPGSVVEAWLNGRLRLGIVTEATPSGVLARLAADAPLPSSPPAAAATSISRGELVSVWPLALTEGVPADGDGAAAILDGARALLRSTPPRALSLDRVYAAARAYKKGDPRGVVTATAIAGDLFLSDRSRRRTSAAAVHPTPATATAAAALLLAADGLRWKRAPGGGWRALPPSVVSTRGTESFVSAARVAADAHSSATAVATATAAASSPGEVSASVPSSSSSSAAAAATNVLSRAGVKALWKRQHLDIVRSLEIAAASDAVPRGAAAAAMTSLGYTPTAAEAARLLRDIGFWSAEPATSTQSPSSSASRELLSSEDSVLSGWTFPPDVLDESRRLRAAARRRRSGFATGATALGRGRRNCLSARGGVWAVDDTATRFLDDAFTIRRVRARSVADRDVWRVTVHIADVDAVVGAGTAMDKLAYERGESLYLPARPLHMLPAAAMEAAGFSKELPTETVAVQMDVDIGARELVDWDVFLAVVGPVRRLTYDGLNLALNDVRKAPRTSVRRDGDESATTETSAAGELRALATVADVLTSLANPTVVPPPARPAKDDTVSADDEEPASADAVAAAAASAAAAARAAGAASAAARGRAPEARLSSNVASVRLVKSAGGTTTPTVTPFRRTRAHTTVSALLSTAGSLFRRHATSAGVPLPERPGASMHAARCGTAPLRRYADLVTQRQLKAVLLASTPSVPRRSPLGRRRIAALRTWLERRHVESRRLVAERRRAALYDAFAGSCEAQMAAAGGGTASVQGVVRVVHEAPKAGGRKRQKVEVALRGVGLTATLTVADNVAVGGDKGVRVGAKVRVAVERVDPVGFVVTGEVVQVL